MDAFHNICKEKLRAADYFFLPAGRHREHQVITITQRQPQGDADLEVDVRDTRIAADQLVHFVNDSRPGNDDIDAGSMKEAHLIIIGMESSVQGGLAIQRDVFEGLLESRVGVDYGAIWPLIQHYDGYHFFPGRNAYSEKETHFFGWAVFAVIWTYDHKTHSTLAFFIHRVYGEFRQINELSDFLPYLVHHKAYATSASFMGYVLGLSLCARLDEYYTDWQHLRKIEGAVGYGYGQKPRRVPGDIDQFTEWLQESGEILINSSGNRRTLRSVGLMLEQVQQTSKNPPLFHFGRQDNVWRRLSEESSTKLIQAIPLISSRIRAHDEYMEYIIVRAERLSAVVSPLNDHDCPAGADGTQAFRTLDPPRCRGQCAAGRGQP